MSFELAPFFFLSFFFFFFKIFCLFIFRKRGRERQREGEKLQCEVASLMPRTGDLAHNLSMCHDWELNWWSFGSQAALSPLNHTSQGWFGTFCSKAWGPSPCALLLSFGIMIQPVAQGTISAPWPENGALFKKFLKIIIYCLCYYSCAFSPFCPPSTPPCPDSLRQSPQLPMSMGHAYIFFG